MKETELREALFDIKNHLHRDIEEFDKMIDDDKRAIAKIEKVL